MALTPEQILAEIRRLPAAERLWVAERIVHDAAAEATPAPAPVETADAIWADESDEDFAEFQRTVEALRRTDIWRAGDGQVPR